MFLFVLTRKIFCMFGAIIKQIYIKIYYKANLNNVCFYRSYSAARNHLEKWFVYHIVVDPKAYFKHKLFENR